MQKSIPAYIMLVAYPAPSCSKRLFQSGQVLVIQSFVKQIRHNVTMTHMNESSNKRKNTCWSELLRFKNIKSKSWVVQWCNQIMRWFFWMSFYLRLARKTEWASMFKCVMAKITPHCLLLCVATARALCRKIRSLSFPQEVTSSHRAHPGKTCLSVCLIRAIQSFRWW